MLRAVTCSAEAETKLSRCSKGTRELCLEHPHRQTCAMWLPALQIGLPRSQRLRGQGFSKYNLLAPRASCLHAGVRCSNGQLHQHTSWTFSPYRYGCLRT
eukprot:2549145-Amphidinium_carterae.1